VATGEQREDVAPRVGRALEALIAEQRRALVELGSEVDRLIDAAAAAVSGGKRLRPAFCYWAWRAAGAPDDDRIIVAASGLELLHASALVHDDVMDESDLRRGHPSSHRAFADLHRESHLTGSPDRFGLGAAILLGDLLLSWSGHQLRASGLPLDAITRGLTYFDSMRTEVISGQYLDLLAQASGEDSVPRAMRVLRFKSAKYTVERPLHVGAALAGAGDELITALSSYGVPLGEAFQLRDDVLGVFGDPLVTGKPAGDDLREGKRTVLTALAMESASPRDRKTLTTNLGRHDLDEAGVASARQAIVSSGARAAVERLISQLTGAALTALERATVVDDAARGALTDLADAATRREV
jgi:geranylgeranyl diphosphate synthase, type I